MAYAITEYEFWGNPKVREAGKDAVLMYLAGNSYCNQFMTDGLIILAAIPTVANLAFQRNPDKAIKALVDNRLWIKVKNGYQVHDYLKHNKSKAQIEDLINKKSAAGRASAKSRVQTPEPTLEPTPVGTPVEQVLNVEHLSPSISYSISNTKDLKKPPPPLDAHDDLVDSVVKTYEQEIGKLTPAVIDDILAVIEDYPLEWFEEAFKEASRNNKPNWRYALAILKRWKIDGYKVDTRTKRANNGRKPKVPDMGGYEVDHTSEVVIVDNGEAFDGELQF